MAMTQDLPEFEAMKRRTQQRFQAQGQQQQDALKRRAAAMGTLNSGAYLKQSQNAAEANTQQQEEAMQTVDAGQQAELRRMKEIQEGREFQKGEREASQGFASSERAASQGFASAEALKQREFAAGESKLGRDLQADQFAKDYDLKNKAFMQSLVQWEENKRLAREKAALDYNESMFNQGMAKKQAEDDSWICTRVNEVSPRSFEEQGLLSRFRKYALKNHNEETRFYIGECQELVRRMDVASVDWREHVGFVRAITTLTRAGNLAAAYLLYRDTMLGLIEKYWPECKAVVLVEANPKENTA